MNIPAFNTTYYILSTLIQIYLTPTIFILEILSKKHIKQILNLNYKAFIVLNFKKSFKF